MYFSFLNPSLSIQIILFSVITIQLVLALRNIDWAALFLYRARQHLVLGALVISFCLWQLRGWLDDQAAIYILGVNLMTLILGWAFATIIVVFNSFLLVVIGVNQFEFMSVNLFFFGCLPIWISFTVYRLVVYWFDNPFAYIFICGFFGAVATLVIPAGFLWLFLSILQSSSSEVVLTYLMYAPVICIPEGVLNGMLLVSFVIFLPDLVKTYDEKRYEENSKTKYK